MKDLQKNSACEEFWSYASLTFATTTGITLSSFQILGFRDALNMFGGIPLYILMMEILFLLAVLMDVLVAICSMRSCWKGYIYWILTMKLEIIKIKYLKHQSWSFCYFLFHKSIIHISFLGVWSQGFHILTWKWKGLLRMQLARVLWNVKAMSSFHAGTRLLRFPSLILEI